MAKFLITVWPFFGHLFPNISIAQAMRKRGHQVAFYTDPKACRIVEGLGFTCFPFQRIDGEKLGQLLASVTDPLASLWKRVRMQTAAWRTLVVDTLPAQLFDLEEILDAWQPDVIICDPTMWGPIVVLHENKGMAVAVFSWTVGCMLPGPDAPPAGLGLPPPRTWATRLAARVVETATLYLTADIRHGVNNVRRRYGLPPLAETVTAYAGRMPLYLVTSIPALDYERRDLPPTVFYVGSCVWSDLYPIDNAVWLDHLPQGQPLVYVSEGTLHNQSLHLLRAAIEGLADLPIQVVLTSGGQNHFEVPELEELAPNIRLEAWVPDSQIIPRADVVITAGGASTVLAALKAGVPLVIVPTFWDKPENAQRVVESGAGLRVAPQHCTPHRLRQVVERVLFEPSFRRQAQQLAAGFKTYRGPERAVELLERLLIRQQ